MTRPVGAVTRGTTAPNRLRRVDRWIAWQGARALRLAADPLVVDLGFGASPVTTVELLTRLQRVRPDVRVVGVEIDPQRVRDATPYSRPGLSFTRGGFELPVAGAPVLVRALNVLRQYDEREVPAAWALLCSRLAPGGLVVDGTCDEVGRRATWVALGPAGPQSLTLSAHLGSLTAPSELAERLPKALIHRNVEGEPIHALLRDLDAAWAHCAPYGSFGVVQRWVESVRALRGWPVRQEPGRWRLGELTLPWECIAPQVAGSPA